MLIKWTSGGRCTCIIVYVHLEILHTCRSQIRAYNYILMHGDKSVSMCKISSNVIFHIPGSHYHVEYVFKYLLAYTIA